jgi:hypothetical protein
MSRYGESIEAGGSLLDPDLSTAFAGFLRAAAEQYERTAVAYADAERSLYAPDRAARVARLSPPRPTTAALYLNTDSVARVGTFLKAFRELTRACGLTLAVAGAPELGSWLQRFKIRASKTLSEDEVKRRLEKLEHSIEIAVLQKPMSDVNAADATAIAKLAEAAAGIDEFVGVAHGVVFVKHTDEEGRVTAFARTLSVREAREFERDPATLRSPAAALELLREYGSETDLALEGRPSRPALDTP